MDLFGAEAEKNPGRWTKVAAAIKGVTEETTTGVHRLHSLPVTRYSASLRRCCASVR